MRGIQATTQEQVGVESDEISPTQRHRLVMPSSRHSVLAKAARYRSEPERVKVLSDEPLLAVVHGLHAEHTVADHGSGLICSCERFRRGEAVCAHVLAVEERRSMSAANTDLMEDGQALSRVLSAAIPKRQPCLRQVTCTSRLAAWKACGGYWPTATSSSRMGALSWEAVSSFAIQTASRRRTNWLLQVKRRSAWAASHRIRHWAPRCSGAARATSPA
jgi:hypothetical protein